MISPLPNNLWIGKHNSSSHICRDAWHDLDTVATSCSTSRLSASQWNNCGPGRGKPPGKPRKTAENRRKHQKTDEKPWETAENRRKPRADCDSQTLCLPTYVRTYLCTTDCRGLWTPIPRQSNIIRDSEWLIFWREWWLVTDDDDLGLNMAGSIFFQYSLSR